MKNLTYETIRDMGEKLPDDLSGILKGFKRLSIVLERQVVEFTSQKLVFTAESIDKAVVRPAVLKEGIYPGVSKILVEPETGNMIQVTMNRDFVSILCEVAFGGDGSEKNSQENRPLSNIEKELAVFFTKIVGREFSASYANHERGKFIIEAPTDSLEERIMPVLKPKLTAKLRCNLKSLTGHISIDLPAEVISRFADQVPALTEEKSETVEKWGDQIIARLEPTNIDLVAVLTELPLTLDAISKMKVGQTVPLRVILKNPVVLEAEGVNLYNAQLGQDKGNYCLVVQSQQSTV